MDKNCAVCVYQYDCFSYKPPKKIWQRKELLMGFSVGIQRIPAKLRSSSGIREIRRAEVDTNEIGGIFKPGRIRHRNKPEKKIITIAQLTQISREAWRLLQSLYPPNKIRFQVECELDSEGLEIDIH
jgi:hypothetical protein